MKRPRVTSEQRRAVRERARGLCEYCRSQMRFSTHEFSVEHILPVQRGGESTLDNLALACQGCNNFKFTKTEAEDPLTKNQAPLYHPRRQRWSDHFSWSYDGTRIVGRSPTGRATVAVLQLNRECLVNFREVLYAVGKHPPSEVD